MKRIYFVLLLASVLASCTSEAEDASLTWEKFCSTRGGMDIEKSEKYGSSFFCKNGEHTHFD